MKQALWTGVAFMAIATGPVRAQTMAEPAPPGTAEPQLTAFQRALAETKPIFDVNLRYETVDADGFAEDAEALTYRIRAGFETGIYYDTKFGIDFEHIEAPIDDYNSTTNGLIRFPVVADPETTELNQLYLTNYSLPDTAATLGRQRIIHDDSRFIGNVGWRQNEQTFDSLRFVNTSIGGLNADVSYVTQVNRIFGEDSPAGRWDSDSVFVDLDYDLGLDDIAIEVSAYSYLLDFEEDAPTASSQTYGVGAKAIAVPFAFEARYAYQADYGENPVDYGANFYDLTGGVTIQGISAAVNYQVLGSDDGLFGFQTPLATLHKFNGFADLFLVTPTDGLEDLNFTLGYKTADIGPARAVSLALTYHEFNSDEGDMSYGDEFDAVLAADFGRTSALFKYATYEADQFGVDTQKLWLQLGWRL